LDRGDRLRRHRVRIELRAHGDAREDAELGPRVETIDVGRRVGFGVTKGLRVSKHGSVAGARFHAAEDVVAGAVDDAADSRDSVTGKPLEHAGDDGNAASDGRSVHELDVIRSRETEERGTAVSDELLVGGNNGL